MRRRKLLHYQRYVEVEVSQEDFHQGKRGDCDECAAALALKRAYPHLYVTVFLHSAVIGEMAYSLTKESTDLIVAWDRGLAITEPRTIRLYNPKKRIMG